jgi:hypothetical protein
MSRPTYTRTDLERLAAMPGEEVRQVLGSVDTTGLASGDLALAVRPLLRADLVEGDADTAALAQAARADLAQRAPDVAPATDEQLATADDALRHRFTFYGEAHDLPARIDWDHNPGTAHWGHDLNRCTYLGPLLAASARTGDERYRRKAAELVVAWVDDVDVTACFRGTPYAFGSYLNNAIHLPAWARVLTCAARDGGVSDDELLRILQSMHEQIAYLEVVTAGHGGNWPTIGCQGILQTLVLVPVLAEQERFVTHCVETLGAQIDEQILPDGVQDELTPHYHTVVVNNLVTAMTCLQQLGRELAPRTVTTLRRMMHYERQAALPCGTQQLAFNDSDPETVPQRGDTFERLGLADAVPADPGPEVFPWAGVALLRQRASAGDLYLAFDGGPFGRSHQHEDKLGLVLQAYGRTLLVDPGRHLYDKTQVSYLDYLRSTAAHSTIRVDGQDQHSRGKPETWVAREADDLGFVTSDQETRARGVYDLGYGADNAIDVVHRREVVFVAQRFWVVFDRVEGDGEHDVESRFQFAPGQVTLEGDAAVTAFDDANLWLEAPGWEQRRIDAGQENPRSGWYSGSYNRIEPSPTLVLSRRVPLPWSTVTLLLPFRGSPRPAVEFEVVEGGAVVTIDGERYEIDEG